MQKYNKSDVRYNFHIKDSYEFNKNILPIPFIQKYNIKKLDNVKNCKVYKTQNFLTLENNIIDTDLEKLKDLYDGEFYEKTKIHKNDYSKYYIDNYTTPNYYNYKEPQKPKINKYVYEGIEYFGKKMNYKETKREFYIIMLCILIFACLMF